MNWSEMNLNEVDTTKQASASGSKSELPAPATYKLRLAGAKDNPFPNQAGTTDIDFIVADGQYKGKHLFTSLPTPDKGSWVAQAASILIKRLGITQIPGESLVETLNRGKEGAGLISADVAPDTYLSKSTGEQVTKPKFQYFSVAAAV